MTFTSILIAVVAVLVIVASLVIAFSWVIARMWCKPVPGKSSRMLDQHGLAAEPSEFSSQEVPIKGWFIPAALEAPLPPVVILAHGWSRNYSELLPLARSLHQMGLAVLLYDTRGHGASGEDGPITVLKFAEDIIAAVDYLEARTDVDLSRLAVLGRSIGGAATILAAARDPRIRAVVSCAAFADPRELTRNYLAQRRIPTWPFTWIVCRFIERWLQTDMENVTPLNRIGQIAAPILLIHGDADRFVPPSDVDALYARANQKRADRFLIPGRRHSDLIRDRRCVQAIIDFFRRNLSLEAAGTTE